MYSYIETLMREMNKQNIEPEYAEIVKKYAINLLDQDLEVIFDLEHFNLLTKNFNKSLVTFFVDIDNYKVVEIPKNNGEFRLLAIPSKDLKQYQNWILKNILEKISISKNAKGFSKGLSIMENAKSHTNKKCVLSIDFENFFPSITYERVFRIFKTVGYTNEVARMLSRICTYMGTLPQGAPTSPYIANLVCLELDSNLEKYAFGKGITYTRYADDLTFSANDELANHIIPIQKIIKDQGFNINHKKTRIKFQHQRQMVTGLIVNNEQPNIPRVMRRRLKQEIYYCKKYGIHGHLSKSKKYYSNYKNHLFGMAYYFKMIDRELGQKFIEELKEIPWEY